MQLPKARLVSRVRMREVLVETREVVARETIRGNEVSVVSAVSVARAAEAVAVASAIKPMKRRRRWAGRSARLSSHPSPQRDKTSSHIIIMVGSAAVEVAVVVVNPSK
jgi:hypothetical protein